MKPLEMTSEEREALKRKYGTMNAILEADEVVGEKASDMLRHYVENILPNGLKAQVVGITRRGAVRYQTAFVATRDELVAEAEKLDAATVALDDLELQGKASTTFSLPPLASSSAAVTFSIIPASSSDEIST